MRISLVTSYYWPAVGGVESYLRHVARGLARRHDVRVLAQANDDRPITRLHGTLTEFEPFEPYADGDVAVRQIRLSRAQRAALAPSALLVTPGVRRYAYRQPRRALAALYARVAGPTVARMAGDADVLHVWSGDLLAAAAVRAAAISGRPSLVTPFVHPGQWNDDPASAVAYRAATRVIGLLETDADVLRRLGRPDNVRVCGVCSPGVAVGGGAAVRAAHRIEGPLVLFLGVRRPYKGFDLLLEAARRLPPGDGEVTVAFAGPGPRIEATSGAAARILDLGAVDEDEKAAWLDAADLLCLPSEGEIFPVSILEAWSAGTPVLVSDIPPLRELVTRSGGGVTVDREPDALARRIAELVAAPERLVEMGENGRRAWQRDYTVDAVVAWHEAEYESAAHDARRR